MGRNAAGNRATVNHVDLLSFDCKLIGRRYPGHSSADHDRITGLIPL
jgi:hypothetical protein